MKKESIFRAIFILIIFLIIIFTMKYMKKLNTTTFEEHTFYQYYGGKKVTYQGKLNISRKNEEITDLEIDNVKIQIDSTPMYYEDTRNKMFMPKDMAIVFPTSKYTMKRLNHFAMLELDSNIAYIISHGKAESIENAFLFDGNDLYVFLENTKLTIGNEEYNLTPFSYAIVSYRNNVEIYLRETDECKTIETKTIEAKASTNEYEINLSTDSIKYKEKEQLLLRKIDVLPKFEMK